MPDIEWPWPPDAAPLAGALLAHDQLGDALGSASDVLGECRVVLWAWRHDPTAARLTADRLAELAARYATRLHRTGVHRFAHATAADAAAFIRAPTQRRTPPAVHTMHLRRTTVRSIHRTLYRLGAPTPDPTAHLELPSRWYRTQRPLTDTENHQLRTAVMTRRGNPPAGAILLALAEAGASTAELTLLRWSAVTDTTVELPGGARILAREAALTEWGRAVIGTARATNDVEPDALVLPGSTRPPGSHPAQAAMTNRLRQLLRTAQLDRHTDVGPRSIRLWAARTAYRRSGRVEDAAGVLGMRSLDATAAAIGLDQEEL